MRYRRRIYSRLPLFLAVTFLLVQTGQAQPNYSDASQRARGHVRRYMEANAVPGMAAAVGVDGQIVWSEAFGYANVELLAPATTSTRFRIGSVSKTVTVAALMLLAQDGHLDLDAPIQKYVPSFPEKRWTVTLRLLAGHLAGIRHYREDEYYSQTHYDGIPAGLAVFKDDSLICRPGTAFNYSSYGYNLIGAAIEREREQPFNRFVKEAVLIPLGMQSMTVDDPELVIDYRSGCYVQARDGTLRNGPYVDNRYKLPAGGYLSNAEDLVIFGMAHLEGRILYAESRRTIFTPQNLADGTVVDNGLGWVVTQDERGRTVYGHLGGAVGGVAVLLVYPEAGLALAWVGNRDTDWDEKPATTLAEFFLTEVERWKY